MNKAQNPEAAETVQTTSVPAVAAATPCSRLGDLLEALDEWIEDALKGSKPIGLTLSRARVTITDQHDRIGEIYDALERQNEKAKTLENERDSYAMLLREAMEVVYATKCHGDSTDLIDRFEALELTPCFNANATAMASPPETPTDSDNE